MAVAAADPSSGGIDLSGLAAAAHRALRGDALVMALLEEGRPAAMVACEGLTAEQRQRVWPVLEILAPELWTGDPLVIPASVSAAASAPAPAGERNGRLLRHGFVGALGVAAPLASEQMVAVVELWREPAAFENEELVCVFVAQAATALDQPARRGRLTSASDRLGELTALENLVLTGTTLEGLPAALNAAIGPMVGARSAGVTIWDDRRRVLRLLPGSFGADAVAVASCRISADDFNSNSARVFSTGRGHYSNDVRGTSALFKDFVDVLALERVLSVPLLLSGRPLGVLHLADKPRPFTPDDLDRVEALAPRIATVVEIAQAHSRLRSQRRLEEVLSDVAVALASGVRVQAFLPPAFEALGEVTEASLLALVPDDGDPVVWRSAAVTPERQRFVLAEAREHPGVRAYVVGPERTGDPGWAAFHVPVRLGTQRVGTLVALRVRAEPFTQEERHAIVRLASVVALGRATERYQQQRAELARLHERQRIAEDLHDDVAQLLFAAQLTLDAALERDGVDAAVAEGISQARGLLVRGDSAIRTVIDRLATPASAELPLRLASAVVHVEDTFGLSIHLEVADDAAEASARLPREACEALLQTARQSMVRSTAEGGLHRLTVALTLRRPGWLILTVEGDGVGAVRRDTRDLTGMRRRLAELGGTLRVRHHPTGGTRVRAALPVSGSGGES